jgi:hypothetical protein
LGSRFRLSRPTPAAAPGAIQRGCGQPHGGPASRPCASRPAAAARCHPRGEPVDLVLRAPQPGAPHRHKQQPTKPWLSPCPPFTWAAVDNLHGHDCCPDEDHDQTKVEDALNYCTKSNSLIVLVLFRVIPLALDSY